MSPAYHPIGSGAAPAGGAAAVNDRRMAKTETPVGLPAEVTFSMIFIIAASKYYSA